MNAQFDAAIQAAEQLRATGVATAEENQKLIDSEQALNDARQKASQQIWDLAFAQVAQAEAGFRNRFLAAYAQITGDPADALTASLAAFDTNAAQQRTDFGKQLTDLYGDSFKSSQNYADDMADLERTLAEERLAIQKQGNDAITAKAKQAEQAR